MDARRIEKAANRSVTVFCPKCGHSQFMSDEKSDRHICQGCNTAFTGDRLRKAAIAKEMPSITKDVTDAISDELSKSIKKIFK
ncbi:hypothetical protein [Thioalkalivibrio sp. HK1]|uniref:hypothetical protein n=1 Tax=Thioalkalivibrio sp. HK1 TaxID=1469245 RepID=UPI0004708D69|nr:hypothetical protein [Thioalkalivibrio sp. HK1]